jgi:hypothetical protein
MLLGSPSGQGGRVAIARIVIVGAGVVGLGAGLLDKVIALGAGWRDEPVLAPSRAELLSIVGGD